MPPGGPSRRVARVQQFEECSAGAERADVFFDDETVRGRAPDAARRGVALGFGGLVVPGFHRLYKRR